MIHGLKLHGPRMWMWMLYGKIFLNRNDHPCSVIVAACHNFSGWGQEINYHMRFWSCNMNMIVFSLEKDEPSFCKKNMTLSFHVNEKICLNRNNCPCSAIVAACRNFSAWGQEINLPHAFLKLQYFFISFSLRILNSYYTLKIKDTVR